jgi:hypothetical protein
MQLLKIANKTHADGFAQNWKYRGILHVIDDVHKQYAIDFANMIVTSFVEEQMRKAQAAAAPKVVIE